MPDLPDPIWTRVTERSDVMQRLKEFCDDMLEPAPDLSSDLVFTNIDNLTWSFERDDPWSVITARDIYFERLRQVRSRTGSKRKDEIFVITPLSDDELLIVVPIDIALTQKELRA